MNRWDCKDNAGFWILEIWYLKMEFKCKIVKD